MFDDLFDLFERDRRKRPDRRGGVRGLLDRLADRDEPDARARRYHDDEDDDDLRDRRGGRRQRREWLDLDD